LARESGLRFAAERHRECQPDRVHQSSKGRALSAVSASAQGDVEFFQAHQRVIRAHPPLLGALVLVTLLERLAAA
jgi:hypothetical protein